MIRKDDASLTLTAVVVNHNGGEDILKCLTALQSQASQLEKILVVDNHSTDGSPEEVARLFPEVVLIRQGFNSGVAVARNAGLQEVGSDLALVIDDDVFVQPEAISRMKDTLIETGASMVCPRILLSDAPEICQCDGTENHFTGSMRLRHAYQPVDRLDSLLAEVDGAIGACSLVRMDALRQIGMFNPLYFIYYEDHEFCLRMQASGRKIVCQPQAVVLHHRGGGTPGLSFRGAGEYPASRALHTIRNRWLTVLLIYQGATLLLLLPAFLLYEAGQLFQATLRGWLPQWLQAAGSLWRVRREIRAHRRAFQKIRTVGDRAILRGGQLPFAPGFFQYRITRLAASALSATLDLYFRLVSPLLRRTASQ